MQKERATGKNWLQLNIQDSSSSENEEGQEKVVGNPNQQKALDNVTCKQSNQEHFNNLPISTRDAFRATKVSRGFFMDKDDNNIEQYDNFSVKQMRLQKAQHNQPILVQNNYNNNQKADVREYKQQETPPLMPQLDVKEYDNQNKYTKQSRFQTGQQVQQRQPNEQQQHLSKTNNKRRTMFKLQISDSQQSDLPDSQREDSDDDRETNHRQDGKNQENSSILELQQRENDQQCSQKISQQHHMQQRTQRTQRGQMMMSTGKSFNMNYINNSNSCSIPNGYKKDFQFTKQPQYHVLDEISKDQRLRAIITRNTSGLNKIWPQFQVKLQSTGLNLLLVVKQTFTINSTYKLYSKLINTEKRYFGRIESNLAKDSYKIFTSYNSVTDNLKAELYFTNLHAGNCQPRLFTVYMLTAESKFEDLVGQNVKKDMTLREYFEFAENKDKIKRFSTRKPMYNEKMGGYMLNFSLRVKRTSIKNFILEDNQTQQQVLMFGRLEDQSFKLQISHPLNCVIGAAIVMVEFEGRLME